jgi:hypothetical protein
VRRLVVALDDLDLSLLAVGDRDRVEVPGAADVALRGVDALEVGQRVVDGVV